MGAPSEQYQLTLPEHIQAELSSRGEQAVIVRDAHPVLVAVDLLWGSMKGPIIGFGLLCFSVGFVVVTRTILSKYLKR